MEVFTGTGGSKSLQVGVVPAPISNKTLFYLKLKMSRKECGNFASNAHVIRYDICNDLACCTRSLYSATVLHSYFRVVASIFLVSAALQYVEYHLSEVST